MDEQELKKPAPHLGPQLSREAEKQWLEQEAAYQWQRIKGLTEHLIDEREAGEMWRLHVTKCNRTNLLNSIALIGMSVAMTVMALFVIASLPN